MVGTMGASPAVEVGIAERLRRVRILCDEGLARRIREASGLSLEVIANDAGTSPSAVSRWERGLRRPTGPGAIRYLEVLERLLPEDAA
jgi:DNA-binding transcriptional regulator YiaG